ncbi:MAG: proprotein convertase P-domain-containing protein [Planctomycetota bacterium]|jgi:subtilisin-like proprotein convertase family protein
MDARNRAKWIVAIAIVPAAGAFFPAAHAQMVYVYGGDYNLPISDPPGPHREITEAAIQVPDHFIISDLDVRINITHTNVFDLQLILQSPRGNRILLNVYDPEKEFGEYENYSGTIFDDEAEFSISEGEPPFTGRFRPRPPNLLSVFDGRDAFGTWTLQICDMFDWDSGTLDSFELVITTPEPTTAMVLTLGAALMVLLRPRRKI